MYRSMLKDEKFGQMFQNDEPPAAQALCKGSLAAGWGLKAHVLGQRDGFHQADTQLSTLSDLENQCIWLCLIAVVKTQPNQGYFIHLHSSREKKLKKEKVKMFGSKPGTSGAVGCQGSLCNTLLCAQENSQVLSQ